MRFLILFLVFALSIFRPVFGSEQVCARLIADLIKFDADKVTRGKSRLAYGMKSSDGKKALIRYGFESEYTLDEIGPLLDVYAPKADFGVTQREWFSWSNKKRVDWVKEHKAELFENFKQAGGLVKVKKPQGLSQLPDNLILDETGNLEIVMGPFDNLEQWYKVVTKVNDTFGVGSMQATVSANSKSFFGKTSSQNTDEVVSQRLGYFKFFSDMDTVAKLQSGYDRYRTSKSSHVVKSFNHPFLGPLTEAKFALMEKVMKANAVGEKFDDHTLGLIRKLDRSFKYYGGTAYRPDIAGPDTIVYEARDAHKNFSLLVDRVLRNTYFLQNSVDAFETSNVLQPFDAVKSFDSMPANVKRMLKDIFPSKERPEVEYFEKDALALQVYRNFSWPLRDWSGHIELFQSEEFAEKLERAKGHYLAKLSDIADKLANGSTKKDTASRQIQGALTKFVNDTKLQKHFDDYYSNRILGEGGQEAVNVLVKEVTVAAGPLKAAFPNKMWDGPLKERMENLAKKYPQNIKIVSDVIIPGDRGNTGTRDLVVISLKDLTEKQEEEIRSDYLAAISLNTVSFPLSEQAGHLYTRLGKNTYDFINEIDQEDYLMTSSRRLEAVVSLTPQEQLNLRTYVNNARKNGDRTLGEFEYSGHKEGTTMGELNDNRPAKEQNGRLVPCRSINIGHNCTSWMGTAPIGKNGEQLLDLVGASATYNIHTGPGWWNLFLGVYSPEEKVPYMIYWDAEKSLAQLENAVKTGKKLNWKFGNR